MSRALILKNLIDRISIRESLLKRNELDPFLRWFITSDEKYITYDNSVRKSSWTKQGEAPQMVAKPGLTPWKTYGSYVWSRIGKESFIMSCYHIVKRLILTCIAINWKYYVKQARGSYQNWLIKRCCLPPRQRPTAHIVGDPAKVDRAWLGTVAD